jgi:carbonic anhydrase/acetyltransferase-like protein (isoleucine patch superfamily)
MKIEEIYAIPVDGDGWRLLPSGNKLMIGSNVQAPDGINLSSIGARASIGAGASIGARASIGTGASIGARASIGAGAHIGAWAHIGTGANIGARASIGTGANIGARASIGTGASIGARASIGTGAIFEKSPLAVQGTRHIAIQHSPGKIAVGCQVHTYAEWKRHHKLIGEANNYTPEEIEEYGRILDFLIANSAPAEAK